tara:strand:+ start:639 stop:974 length:336 start_codon:yes stop_codon:yes gene_type:complete
MIDTREIRGKAKLRSPAHRKWVREHRCCVPNCYQMPIECAHVRRASNAGIGIKSSDAFTVSLCRDHHSESHRGEQTFEKRHDIDLMALAKLFYQRSPHRGKLDDPWKESRA